MFQFDKNKSDYTTVKNIGGSLFFNILKGFFIYSYNLISSAFSSFPSGLTFGKRFNSSDLDSDFSVGSPTATYTASRSASAPATVIEEQDGNALLFDGVDDQVIVADDAAIQDIFDGGGKVSFKFTKNTASLKTIVSKRGVGKGWHVTVFTSGAIRLIREASVLDGTWTTAAATAIDMTAGDVNEVSVEYDDSSLSNDPVITINGVVQAFDTNTNPQGTVGSDVGEPLDLGNRDGAETLDGQISDVKLYKGASLVAHYDFSDGSGSTLTDIVGSNNGTITGAKWLVDGEHYINKVTASNVGRIAQGYYDSTGFSLYDKPGLMVEAAGTNLLVHSIFDADTAGLATGWTQVDNVTNVCTKTIVSEDFTNISGSQAQRLQQTFGDGTTTYLYSDLTAVGSVAQDDVVTISVWLKGAVTGITNLKLYLAEHDDAGVGGTFHGSADIQASLSATEWRRFTLSTTCVDADCSRGRIYIYVNHPGSGSIDLQIAAAQLEKNPTATSFIPTTSVALTRGAEVPKYETAGNRTAAEETIFIKFAPFGDFANDGVFRVFSDTNTKRRLCYKVSTGTKIKMFPNNTDSFGTSLNTDTSPLSNISYVYSAVMSATGNPNLQVYMDGSQEGADDNNDFTVNAWGTSFYIGSDASSTSQLNGIIQEIRFYNRALTEAEVSAVTTQMS